MAGGKGTRLRPVLANRPKCLALVNGKPFLHFQLSYLAAQGIREVILCGGYLMSMVYDEIGNSFKGISILYAEEEIPLGTGGALWNGITRFRPEELFAVLNGDTMFTINLHKLARELRQSQAGLAVGLTLQQDDKRYGAVSLNDMGFVTSIGIERPKKYPFAANGGVWVGSPSIVEFSRMAFEPPFSLEHLVNSAIAGGFSKVRGVTFESTFIDIGVPEDLVRAAGLRIFQERES